MSNFYFMHRANHPPQPPPVVGAIGSLGLARFPHPPHPQYYTYGSGHGTGPPRPQPHPFAHIPKSNEAQPQTTSTEGTSRSRFSEIPCKFFTFGACKKGNSCLFSHAHEQVRLNLRHPMSEGQHPSHYAPKDTDSTRILAKANQLMHTIDDSMKSLTHEMQKDLVLWENSNIWKLSAYGLPGYKTIDGFRDKSPEQVRWELMQNDDVQLTRLVNLHQNGIRNRKMYCASPQATANAIKTSMDLARASEAESYALAQQLDSALHIEALSYQERVKMFFKDIYGRETRPDFNKRIKTKVFSKTPATEGVGIKGSIEGLKKEIPKMLSRCELPPHALTKTKVNVEDLKDVLSESFVNTTHEFDGTLCKQMDIPLSPLCSPKIVSLINASLSSEKVDASFGKARIEESQVELSNQPVAADNVESQDPEMLSRSVSPISIDKAVVSPRRMLLAVRKSPSGGPSTSTPKPNRSQGSPDFSMETFNQSSFQEFHTAVSFDYRIPNESLGKSQESSSMDQDSSSADTSETGTTEIEINPSLEVGFTSSPDSDLSRKKNFFSKFKTVKTRKEEPSFESQLDDSKEKCIIH